MILEFDKLDVQVVPHFKGGQGEAHVRTAVQDDMGRILLLTLPAGSSIGLHTHQGNCEIIHVLSGCGVCHDDGTDTAISAGMTHYCPEGHTHGIDNTGADELVLLGILPVCRLNFFLKAPLGALPHTQNTSSVPSLLLRHLIHAVSLC